MTPVQWAWLVFLAAVAVVLYMIAMGIISIWFGSHTPPHFEGLCDVCGHPEVEHEPTQVLVRDVPMVHCRVCGSTCLPDPSRVWEWR